VPDKAQNLPHLPHDGGPTQVEEIVLAIEPEKEISLALRKHDFLVRGKSADAGFREEEEVDDRHDG